MINKRMLKAAMAMAGMTQSALADAVGSSRQAMSYWINGRRELSLSTIQKMSEALSLTDEQKLTIFFADSVEK